MPKRSNMSKNENKSCLFYTLKYQPPCSCSLARCSPSWILVIRDYQDYYNELFDSLWLNGHVYNWEVLVWYKDLQAQMENISLSYHFLTKTVANSQVCREHSNNKNIR